MINLFLAMFFITELVSLVWVSFLTDENTQEEQKEMLDSDEMFP